MFKLYATGEGPTIKVQITKRRKGRAVSFRRCPEAAAAIREVDLQKKYHLSPQQLVAQLGLSTNRCKALH